MQSSEVLCFNLITFQNCLLLAVFEALIYILELCSLKTAEIYVVSILAIVIYLLIVLYCLIMLIEVRTIMFQIKNFRK